MTNQTRILVVDDEENLRHMLSLALSKEGYHVWTAASGRDALGVLRNEDPFDICITDVRMPGMDGLAFIESALGLGERAPTFIAMSAFGDEKLAIEAMRRGAFDYISKPFDPKDLSFLLQKVSARPRGRSKERDEQQAGAEGQKQPDGLSEIISVAPAMERIFRTVRKTAKVASTVLITGETGTGKERIAGAIHSEGTRAGRPFVAVNCGAIPPTLLETELFGTVKGAYTDAKTDRPGLFEVANNGTLFLDEIAEVPLQLQVKLLRALEAKEIRRVGDTKTITIDVRVIAATARDMAGMVKSGTFREDLFYRLNVVTIHLPALRDRREDIPELVFHFVKQIGLRLGLAPPEVTEESMKILRGYSWPGNVRELENAIERALVLSDGGSRLTAADLDERFDETDPGGHGLDSLIKEDELSLKVVIPKIEQMLIRRALEKTGGNRTKAATLLGISHRALLYKLRDHGIS